MPKLLKALFFITDVGFLAYWGVTALAAAKIVSIPAAWLFREYADPNIVAWNWSFMPLDVLASVTGLFSVWLAGKGRNWKQMALISMTLTFCAGFMAVSFWAFQGSFEASWWAANIFLVAWPIMFAHFVMKS